MTIVRRRSRRWQSRVVPNRIDVLIAQRQTPVVFDVLRTTIKVADGDKARCASLLEDVPLSSGDVGHE